MLIRKKIRIFQIFNFRAHARLEFINFFVSSIRNFSGVLRFEINFSVHHTLYVSIKFRGQIRVLMAKLEMGIY